MKGSNGIAEYIVGPVPTSSETTIQPLDYYYNSGRNYVAYPLPELEDVFAWFENIINGEMKDLIDDLLGEVIDKKKDSDSKAPTLMAISRPAPSAHDQKRHSWITIHAPGEQFDAWSLLPQGMYARFGKKAPVMTTLGMF
jgi:primary-amine oxidase